MNNFKNFIFGSKKRLAILILAVAALGIPLTITLVGQQQDIRQRAEGLLPKISGYPQLTPKLTGYIQPSGYPLPSGYISSYPKPTITLSGFPSIYPSVFPSPTLTKIPIPTDIQTDCSTCLAQGEPYICYSVLATRQGPFCSSVNLVFESALAGCISCGQATPTPTSTSNTPTPTIPTGNCTLRSQGDANCDGRVNTDDFNIWRDEFLKVVLSKKSDFNNDGTINTDDFNIWRDGFLNTSIPH